ncbi:hypothetical protein D3C87_650950 [compost metagenome]
MSGLFWFLLTLVLVYFFWKQILAVLFFCMVAAWAALLGAAVLVITAIGALFETIESRKK